MRHYKVGDSILYIYKGELGIVKEILPNNKVRAYWSLGGTAAVISEDLILRLTQKEVLNKSFSNEYAKASLLERQKRLVTGVGDTSDLIDNNEVSPSIMKNLGLHNVK